MPTTTITTDDLRKHVNGLQAIGTQMEKADDPRWLPIAQAAALLEGLRLGLVVIEPEGDRPPPRWIGIDLAKPNAERTAFGGRHA